MSTSSLSSSSPVRRSKRSRDLRVFTDFPSLDQLSASPSASPSPPLPPSASPSFPSYSFPKSPAVGGPIRRCLHLLESPALLAVSACEHTIATPDEWICMNCETSESIRLCLQCGRCVCVQHFHSHSDLVHSSDLDTQRRETRKSKKENEKQFNSAPSSHFLMLQLNSEEKTVFCRQCRCLVANDTKFDDLAKLRALIQAVQSLNVNETNKEQVDNKITIPKLRFLSKRAIAERAAEDKLITAIHRWRHGTFKKYFLSWKSWSKSEKQRKLSQLYESDEEKLEIEQSDQSVKELRDELADQKEPRRSSRNAGKIKIEQFKEQSKSRIQATMIKVNESESDQMDDKQSENKGEKKIKRSKLSHSTASSHQDLKALAARIHLLPGVCGLRNLGNSKR
jgi:hypothetical protein